MARLGTPIPNVKFLFVDELGGDGLYVHIMVLVSGRCGVMGSVLRKMRPGH